MSARAAAERLTAERVANIRQLGGSLFEVALQDGRTAVAKRGSRPNDVVAEAAGLRWLGESGDVPIPAVLGADDEWLVSEYVRPGPATVRAAEAFGRGLARLHLRGAPAYGSPPPGGPADASMGLTPMRNEPCPDWPTFFGAHRIAPYVRMAADQGRYSARQIAVFDEVRDRLPELAGPPEPPARLHGDTWSGNIHWGHDGQVWLIDPAAHGGHRETDLAVLAVFGLPHLERVLGAYAEEAEAAGAPLAPGWRDRTELHQLHFLLVHAVLFGGGYAGQALAAAQKTLRAG
ncbi:Fructosamine-3-kinase [Amycolatopsis marina]|uniref:Fructosamine-3-kinase n=1 Tax=Amycolatopsis marina TaxID=490629 RepID=A0A1I1BLP3_9PSEU|nr:fructosamine kinase family protein [Amycolatopsis marina]SFB51201.1 Fructosamine-3-kinase [Amycolatopsis marina]